VAALTVGKICMKTAGREAGRYCVVLKKIDNNFFLVTGPKVLNGVKKRRCNIDHLEPTEHSVKIEAEASDKAVIQAYEKAGLLKKLGLKKPSPEIVKEAGKPKKEIKPKEEVKKSEKKEEEKKPEKKEKVEEKEGKTITIKLPSLRKTKEPEKKKEVKTARRKIPKKVETKKKKAKKK